jgi:hypothetical protein
VIAGSWTLAMLGKIKNRVTEAQAKTGVNDLMMRELYIEGGRYWSQRRTDRGDRSFPHPVRSRG